MVMNPPFDRQRKTWLAWVVLLMIGGVFLLLANLGGVPFANDEAAYIRFSMEGWDALLAWIASDNYPPLWLLGFKVWLDLVGPDPFLLRLSSLPFVLVGWGVVAVWGFRRLPPRIALFWLILVITSPLLVYIFRLAKYFAALNFLVLVAFVLLWELLEEDRGKSLFQRPWILAAWMASSLAMLWIHYTAAGCWVAMGCWLLWRGWKGNPRAWKLLGLLLITFLGFVPHLFELIPKVIDRGTGEVSHPHLPSARRLVIQSVYTAYAFTIGHTIEASRVLLVIPGILIPVGFFLAGTLHLLRKRSAFDEGGETTPETRLPRFAAFALTMAVIYIGFNMTVMWFFLGGLPDLHIPERTSAGLPFLLLVLAVGWTIPRGWLAALPAGIYGALVAFSLVNTITMRESNPWDQLIPWDQIHDDIVAQNPVLVAGDNWHFGSRPWVYFSRDDRWDFVELRWLDRDGLIDETARHAAGNEGTIVVIRSTRDSSIGFHVTRFHDVLMEDRGEADLVLEYVHDSPSMVRLKDFMRRGTGQETHTGKVQVLVWSYSQD